MQSRSHHYETELRISLNRALTTIKNEEMIMESRSHQHERELRISLNRAIEQCNLELVTEYINLGADLNKQIQMENIPIPLHCAMQFDLARVNAAEYCQIVGLLLQKGAQLDVVDPHFGLNAFDWFMRSLRRIPRPIIEGMVSVFVSADIKPTADQLGRLLSEMVTITPDESQAKIRQQLLKAGASLRCKQRTEEGYSLLVRSAASASSSAAGWEQALLFLEAIKKFKCPYSIEDLGIVLFYAIKGGHASVIELLLELGADPNFLVLSSQISDLELEVNRRSYRVSPSELADQYLLHHAITLKNTYAIKNLLLYGADIRLSDSNGKKAFDLIKDDDVRRCYNHAIEEVKTIHKARYECLVLDQGGDSNGFKALPAEIRIIIKEYVGQGKLAPERVPAYFEQLRARLIQDKTEEKIFLEKQVAKAQLKRDREEKIKIQVSYFKKIYTALRDGQSGFFKTNFLDGKDQLNDETFMEEVFKHIVKYPHSRTSFAWNLVMKMKRISELELFKRVYEESFAQSGFFKSSSWLEVGFFNFAGMGKITDKMTRQQIQTKIANNPNSRTAKIAAALW